MKFEVAPDKTQRGQRGRRKVSSQSIAETVRGMIADENRVRGMKRKAGFDVPLLKGRASENFVLIFRREYGFTLRATHESKHELDYDDEAQQAFRCEVSAAIKESTEELVGNVDEMWRRQMRDDGVRSLQLDPGYEVSNSEAKPALNIEWGPLGVRARAIADFGSWAGPWVKSPSGAQRALAAMTCLVKSNASYMQFDKWQKAASGRSRRGHGRKTTPKPLAQNCRSDAPPGHRKGKRC